MKHNRDEENNRNRELHKANSCGSFQSPGPCFDLHFDRFGGFIFEAQKPFRKHVRHRVFPVGRFTAKLKRICISPQRKACSGSDYCCFLAYSEHSYFFKSASCGSAFCPKNSTEHGVLGKPGRGAAQSTVSSVKQRTYETQRFDRNPPRTIVLMAKQARPCSRHLGIHSNRQCSYSCWSSKPSIPCRSRTPS